MNSESDDTKQSSLVNDSNDRLTDKIDTPRILDQLGEQFERIRVLRRSDEASMNEMLDGLGARSKVDRDIVLELSATRALGDPERFNEAHALAMRALEVLDRNGAREVPAPARLGPVRPVAQFLIGLVCRFIVRNYQARLADAISDLYERRLAWCDPKDPMRTRLFQAARDARRVSATYNANPIGVPTFLVGGAAVSGLGSLLRGGADAALGSQGAAIAAVVIFTLLFGALAWSILRGAAVARRRITLTVTRPVQALWETIGRAGEPPKDQSKAFALYGVALTAVSWFVVPAGIVFVLSRF